MSFFRISLFFASFLFFSSCTGHIGYGVVTWSLPEQGLAAGDIVPVFIQSNIGKVYVAGVGNGGRTRIEIPLWQLKLHKSKSLAKKEAKVMEEFRYTYATVKLDGLPIRAMPENTARQVYRLKEGQKIKIVRKGEGTPVFAGNSPLEGDWFEVMTDDGSTGWCFSYNYTLFDERTAENGAVTAVDTGPDTVLENLLSRSWYPDLYRTMIQSNQVDISRINPSWGFSAGRDSGIARLETAENVLTFPYSAIVKSEEGTYRFEGSSLVVQARRNDSIVVQYTDADGMPQAHYFSSLDTSPEMLVENERARRAEVLAEIRKAGPRFVSGNYGVLQFLEDGRFLWSGYQLLSPSVIPSGSGGGGMVESRCFLSESLVSGFTGVLSFRFESSAQWIHFLYILTPQGLKLEQASDSNIKDSIVLSQNLTPTVLFFTPDAAERGAR